MDDGDESINQECLGRCAIVEEEGKEHSFSQGASSYSSKQTISQNVFEARKSQPFFQFQSYLFSQAQPTQYKSKVEIVKKYTNKRNLTLEENQKLMTEARKFAPEKASLITVKEPIGDSLNIVVVDQNKVVEFQIRMDKVNVPDKIHFHKQSSEVLYSKILHSSLATNKLEIKVAKLEEKLRKERALSKGWQTQVKKIRNRLDGARNESRREEISQKIA